jgi:RNA polymerase sigma-54 factor
VAKINSCLNYAKAILNLKLSQKLSPQQIQLMKLIQLPTQAFEQRLLEEMNENRFRSRKEEDEYEKMSLRRL